MRRVVFRLLLRVYTLVLIEKLSNYQFIQLNSLYLWLQKKSKNVLLDKFLLTITVSFRVNITSLIFSNGALQYIF